MTAGAEIKTQSLGMTGFDLHLCRNDVAGRYLKQTFDCGIALAVLRLIPVIPLAPAVLQKRTSVVIRRTLQLFQNR
jgi:hypothetical protein